MTKFTFDAGEEQPRDWADEAAWSMFEQGKVISPAVVAAALRGAGELALEKAAKVGISLARTHYDNRADAIMEYVAAIRAMKGKP